MEQRQHPIRRPESLAGELILGHTSHTGSNEGGCRSEISIQRGSTIVKSSIALYVASQGARTGRTIDPMFPPSLNVFVLTRLLSFIGLFVGVKAVKRVEGPLSVKRTCYDFC